jgi:glycosyltransferase involved in cell wall biosynthesis
LLKIRGSFNNARIAMRIAHLIHGLGLGGAQQVIKFLVAGRTAGFEHVVLSCHGGVFQEQLEAAGAEVEIVRRRLPKFDPFWVAALAQALQRRQVDVVHGHLFGDSLHGYLAARRLGLLPMVMTLHNATAARSHLQLFGYRQLLKARTRPVACAEFVRRSFVERMGPLAERIVTINNGLPAPKGVRPDRDSVARELGLDPAALWLATLGRLVEQKGYVFLLEALSGIARQDVQLVLFGEGNLRAELETRVRDLGLQGRVFFAGYRADASALLTACDIVVFSSLVEGLPIALLEAMAGGRALVATRVGGIPAALEHEKEALLVASGNAAALAAALKRLIAEPTLRTRLGQAAAARFAADFRAERMVESYEQVYRAALAERRQS